MSNEIIVVFGNGRQAQQWARDNGVNPMHVFSADRPDSLRGRCGKVRAVNLQLETLISPARRELWRETRENIRLVEMRA